MTRELTRRETRSRLSCFRGDRTHGVDCRFCIVTANCPKESIGINRIGKPFKEGQEWEMLYEQWNNAKKVDAYRDRQKKRYKIIAKDHFDAKLTDK